MFIFIYMKSHQEWTNEAKEREREREKEEENEKNDSAGRKAETLVGLKKPGWAFEVAALIKIMLTR